MSCSICIICYFTNIQNNQTRGLISYLLFAHEKVNGGTSLPNTETVSWSITDAPYDLARDVAKTHDDKRNTMIGED